MVGILSVDFDYFIDVTAEEREIFFPQGNDNMPPGMVEAMWKERYAEFPKLGNIGVINEYFYLKNYLMLLHLGNDHIFKSDSHKNIMKLIETIPQSTQIRLVNIDFHHDYYHYFCGDDYCNCGNWLRRLLEKRPDTKVKWIRREDSQTVCLDGEIPFEHTTDIKSVSIERFSYIFMCRSPEWSPPHLSFMFDSLFRSAAGGRPA